MNSQLEHRGVYRRAFARQLLEIIHKADQPLITREVTRAIMGRLRLNPFGRDAVDGLSRR